MQRPALRVITNNGSLLPEPVPERIAYKPPVQLPLFDLDPPGRIVCVPMNGLHGNIFAKALHSLRPKAVVDVRPFPYFDLITFDRDRAFGLIESVGSRYVHASLSLRQSAENAERWALRHSVAELLSRLKDETGSMTGPFAFLVNTKAEAELLLAAVPDKLPGTPSCWLVETI